MIEKTKDFINMCKSHSYHINKDRILLLIRYVFAGGLSFITNIALLYYFETYLMWWYLTASTMAFVISVIVSFLAQKYITFRNKSRENIPKQMVQYIAIAIFNVITNGIIVFLLVNFVKFTTILSQVISAIIIAVWSLFVYRFIIFRHEEVNHQN